MKILIIGCMLTLGWGACGPTRVVVQSEAPQQQYVNSEPQTPAPVQEVSYQHFYDELSPYGTWIDYPGYGYVWLPNTDPGFKPYATNGHWVYTDEGWTWASDYNWGWATFHYGRWFYEQDYGWMWKPGYQWAPAWVSWRRSSDYYGWAPLGPNVNTEIAISNYDPPNNYWCFVPQRYVTSPHVNNYTVNETKNVTIINNTTVINNNVTNNNITNNNITNNTNNINNITNNTTNNNITNNTTNNNVTSNNTNNRVTHNTVNINRTLITAGPSVREVEAATGERVQAIPIRTTGTPVSTQVNNGQLNMYRPRVSASPVVVTGNGQQRIAAAPAAVVPLRDVSPGRQMLNQPAPRSSNPAGSTGNAGNAPGVSNNAPTQNRFVQPSPNATGTNAPPNRSAGVPAQVVSTPVNRNNPPANAPTFIAPPANQNSAPVNGSNNPPANPNRNPNNFRPVNNPPANRPVAPANAPTYNGPPANQSNIIVARPDQRNANLPAAANPLPRPTRPPVANPTSVAPLQRVNPAPAPRPVVQPPANRTRNTDTSRSRRAL